MHYLSTNPAGPGCIWVIHETRCGQAQASWANGGLTQPQKPPPSKVQCKMADAQHSHVVDWARPCVDMGCLFMVCLCLSVCYYSHCHPWTLALTRRLHRLSSVQLDC